MNQKLDAELSALQQRLQDISLTARSPSRDQLMYQCGVAAAANATPHHRKLRVGQSAIMLILGVCLGLVVSKRSVEPPAEIAGDRQRPHLNELAQTDTSVDSSLHEDAQWHSRIAEIRRGNVLYAAIPRAALGSLPSRDDSPGQYPAAQSPPLSASSLRDLLP